MKLRGRQAVPWAMLGTQLLTFPYGLMICDMHRRTLLLLLLLLLLLPCTSTTIFGFWPPEQGSAVYEVSFM